MCAGRIEQSIETLRHGLIQRDAFVTIFVAGNWPDAMSRMTEAIMRRICP